VNVKLLFFVSQDNVPPQILKYRLRTVMEECGNPPGQITFREKMGKTLGKLKSKLDDLPGLASLIVEARLGHFLELNEDHWKKGCGNLLHFFLLRQIKCNKMYEYWFLVGNKPIKFGMREFCLVTGLSCGPYPPDELKEKVVAEGDLFVDKVLQWVKEDRRKERLKLEEMRKQAEQAKNGTGKKGTGKKGTGKKGTGKGKGSPVKGEEKKVKEKKIKSDSSIFCDDLWNIVCLTDNVFSPEERCRCALMYLVQSVVLGEQEANSVSESFLAMTANTEFFAAYPWGRCSYEKLIGNLERDFTTKAVDRLRKIEKGARTSTPIKYTVAGFWQAFMVWAYEAVDRFGADLGFRSIEKPDAIPRVLRWHSIGFPARLRIDKLEEKVAGNQVSNLWRFDDISQ
jgi:Domain of unknown function (DUF1985)